MEMNPFVQGGLLMGLVGGLFVWLKSLPLKLVAYVKAFFSITITIENTDSLFGLVFAWMGTDKILKRSRRLIGQLQYGSKVQNTNFSAPSESFDSSKPLMKKERSLINWGLSYPFVSLIAGFGIHYTFYKGRILILNYIREEAKAGVPERRVIVLTFLTRDKKLISQFFDELSDSVSTENPSLYAYIAKQSWRYIEEIPPRPLESVFLNEGQKEDIIQNISKFQKNESWYLEKGIPYKLGILFYGVPGSGKSSLAQVLASHFKLSLYYLNLNSIYSDDELTSAFRETPSNSILLLEDIDCMDATKSRKTKKDDSKEDLFGITLSGLLNVLDGALTKHGRIVIMTTNHVEKLDPALIRAGRVDVKFEFGQATREQITGLYQRFYPEAPVEYVSSIPSGILSMAEVQNLFLSTKNPEELLHLNGKLSQLISQKQEVLS